MKGKVLSLKIVLTLLFVLTASFSFAVGSFLKSEKTINSAMALEKVLLGKEGEEEEFSALAEGGVILSVEKVGVNSLEDTNGYPNSVETVVDKYKTFLGGYDEKLSSNRNYTFVDLANNSSNKTVVESGEFIRLNNNYSSNQIVMPNKSELQEAVMISFGAYVQVEDSSIQIAKDGTDVIHAGITYLDVSLYKNGNKQDNLPDIRNIGTATSGLYFDFVHLITQKEDNSNEGYYQFEFNYMVGNVSRSASFDFYILNNSTYEQTINPEGKDWGYNAKPTLGWIDSELDTEFISPIIDGYVRYNIGTNGVSSNTTAFPTITYDYTKFKLTYSHTANQKNTSYDVQANISGSGAELVVTQTSSFGTVTKPYTMIEYHETNLNNLVTIMFTEPGTYEFNYTYIYRGYNANVAPELDFETETFKLAIHGLSTQYSKIGFESAKLQYFEIASKAGNFVDLVVPNGFEFDGDISKLENQKLGFAYKLVESEAREGDVLSQNSVNSLINNNLVRSTNVSGGDYKFLTSNITKIADLTKVDDESFRESLTEVLSNIEYVSTNQGSLWIEGNDKYVAATEGVVGSFFYHSSSPISLSDLTKLNNNGTDDVEGDDYFETTKNIYTNITTFNKKGYYLVFMEIVPNGMSSGNNFWQIFAFQYSSSSVDIDIKAVDNKGTESVTDDVRTDVAGGKYTNKPVEIMWEKPGVFDKGITSWFYSSKNSNKTKNELLSTFKNELKVVREEVVDGKTYCVAQLGDLEQAPQGSFVKYLIRLESEGDSATHKIVTIDRQAISGIQPYLIQEIDEGSSIFYAYATDTNNRPVPIYNSLTDSYATLEWNDKDSGATITATYSYTPFSLVTKTEDNVLVKDGNNGKTWITTNYVLGETIYGSEFTKPTSRYLVSSNSILFNQGIYIVNLKDDAGNQCDYAFVIDRTNGYFNVEGQLVSNSSVVFGDNVNYTIGDYKAFKLETTDTKLKNFIQAAATKDYSNLENYYAEINTNNKASLAKLFQKMGGEYYFTVQNLGVVAYEGLKLDNSIVSNSGELKYKVDGGSYYKRKLHIIAENNVFTTKDDTSKTFVEVTINKDNARGEVYYSSSVINAVPGDGETLKNVEKLDTGSDGINESGIEVNGISKAYATSAKHVAFTWIKGSGSFEVARVYYKVYSLNQNLWNEDTYFYYSNDDKEIDLYNNGEWKNNAKEIAGGRGLVSFNGDSDSVAGLYVVTREYKKITNTDLDDEDVWGDDDRIKNYYFIVDRNGIIQGDIGAEIKIELMEGESNVQGSSFSTQNADDGYLGDEKYFIYLNTTKVPATINVPTGKYVSTTHSSAGYLAGQLNVSVHFVDVDGQLFAQHKNKSVKIYDSIEMLNRGKLVVADDGTFVIDIYEYLSINTELRDRLTETTSAVNADRKEWLFLPGEYVIKITDNVVDTLGKTHTKLIGFKIDTFEDNGPQVNAYTGYTKSSSGMIKLNSLNTNYSATVSQEFLKVELPNYIATIADKAQVDPNYIVVKQFSGENAKGVPYVDHPYKPAGSINLKENSQYVTIENNVVNVWLSTKLRVDEKDPTSAIDEANLNKPLYYTITIRYKLNNLEIPYDIDITDIDLFEKYKNCYVYYSSNGTKVDDFFYKTYTIHVDRDAPTENIKKLNETDNLVSSYNEKNGLEAMIENGVHETGSSLYFTKQYAKYYQENREDKGAIYAYIVKNETEFITSGVSKVWIRQIPDLKTFNLTLPIVDDTQYPIKRSSFGFDKFYYGNLGLTNNMYYEVVEFDFAGNTTQYVIHYNPERVEVELPFKFTFTNAKTEEENVILNTEENTESKYVYNLEANGETQIRNGMFVKIEIKKGETLLETFLTNATTNLEELTEKIVKTILDENYGQFTITVTTQRGETSGVAITLFDQQAVVPLEIEKLYDSDRKQINLHGANVYDAEKELWYFATKIVVNKDEYVGELVENIVKYKDAEGNIVSTIECADNTTYYIEMTEVLEPTKSKKYRFNTSGLEFITLEFEDVEDDEENDYYLGNVGTDFVYYGYTKATLRFDKTIYISKIYKKTSSGNYQIFNLEVQPDEKDVYNKIEIEPIYNSTTGEGGLVEYKIELYYQGVCEKTYFITIDNRLSSVALRDYNTGEKRDIIRVFNNADYEDSSIRSDESGSGYMNLAWNVIEENEYFNYTYLLHEMMKDETYKTTNLNNLSTFVIATAEDSKGIYKFEICVNTKDGKYLGNRIYVFEVQEVSTQVYYVRNEAGEAITENSYFKVSELTNYHTAITTKFVGINVNLNLPLYVTNQTLEVVTTSSDVEKTFETFATNPYEFTIYKISKENSYDIYLGILKINENHTLVNDVKVIGKQTIDVVSSTNLTISGDKTTDIFITANVAISGDTLLRKNEVYINIYYNDQLVETSSFENGYTVLGNGQYAFTFTDLAGNVHEFAEDEDHYNTETVDQLKVYVLREVVVTVNGEAPIKNAFYNDEVSLSIYASNKYVTGSISVSATKNGSPYEPTGFNPYVFSDYGTYRVIIQANYAGLTKPLTNVITFTIVNVKEARKSIDLTSLNGCKIQKVLNQNGRDITKAFNTMMQQTASNRGLNISYDDIVAYEANPLNKDKLYITSGKQTFTITYLFEDGVYPTREVDLSFTLNNEDAFVPCTLAKGDKTTKSFEIYFNPSILYEKVGEAYVYINGKIVAHIDENSANTEMRIKTSYKSNGDGDYYIKLVSSSGVILDSFKVTIKEPLNFWAILVIIVIVGVVATVVITIVVLRRKMRIR